jgi:hypothetical protein
MFMLSLPYPKLMNWFRKSSVWFRFLSPVKVSFEMHINRIGISQRLRRENIAQSVFWNAHQSYLENHHFNLDICPCPHTFLHSYGLSISSSTVYLSIWWCHSPLTIQFCTEMFFVLLKYFLMLVILLCLYRLRISGDHEWTRQVESGSVILLQLKSSEFNKKRRERKQTNKQKRLG